MPSTEWKEVIAPGEPARLERQAEQLRAIQRQNAAKGGGHREDGRALHRKSLGGIEARFEVLGDLPEHCRVGLFAKPQTFDAIVRFSNGSAAHQNDGRPDIRGVAIKLLGVEGPKIIEGLEKATTQDFLFIQTPATPFKDSEAFVGLVWAARNRALALPRLLLSFGVGGTFKLIGALKQGLATSHHRLHQQRFFSALPIKFGPYAAKLCLDPQGGTPSGPEPRQVTSLAEELADELKERDVVYEFRAQFFEDESRTPIEDASVEWSEAVAPFVTIARLTLPKQDLTSAASRERQVEVERMSFDPWHATEDFRPIGEMMRARKVAYKVSVIERNAAPEPGVD